MHEFLADWLSHASLGLLVVALIVAGVGVPLPEDLVLLLAGALAHRTPVSLFLVIPVCACGVLIADVLLFTSARRLGTAALEKPFFRRLLPPKQRGRIEAMFAKRGPLIIFVARHLAALRAPVFVMAGIHGMPLWRFVLWDVLAMLVSVPATVILGYLFYEQVGRIEQGVSSVEQWVVVGLVAILVLYVTAVWVRRLRATGGSAHNRAA